MADMFRDVSNQGWLGRIGSSIKGVLVGGVLVLICVLVLFLNEGRAVNEAKRIAEGEAACVSVDAASVSPANEGKLIHIAGDASTTDKPADDTFGLSAPALRLQRDVEMYQWIEKKETSKHTKLGGGEETVTTCTYNKEWDDSLQDSSEFKHPEDHHNPDRLPYKQSHSNASPILLGAFRLSTPLVEQMDNFEPLRVSDSTVTLPPEIKSTAKFADGGVYIGKDPASPAVGDARIHFQVVKPGPFSVIGQQVGSTFQAFHSAHGDTLDLAPGIKSAQEMFQAAEARNATITWLLRLGGFVFMWIGLMMLVRPLKVVADVLPFAGSLVEFAGGLVMLLVAGAVSFITIAIAWLFYRPVLGIGLLILAAGCIWLIVRARKRHVAASPAFQRIPPPPIPS